MIMVVIVVGGKVKVANGSSAGDVVGSECQMASGEWE